MQIICWLRAGIRTLDFTTRVKNSSNLATPSPRPCWLLLILLKVSWFHFTTSNFDYSVLYLTKSHGWLISYDKNSNAVVLFFLFPYSFDSTHQGAITIWICFLVVYGVEEIIKQLAPKHLIITGHNVFTWLSNYNTSIELKVAAKWHDCASNFCQKMAIWLGGIVWQ